MTPAEHANAIEDAIVEYGEACIGNALQPSRETKARCLRAHRALRAATRAGVGAAPPKDSAEFALAALVAAGHVSQSKVDYARALMPPPESKAEQHDSDCAKHNAPAYPPGPCDCSLSKADPEGWQPIETAPKDGSSVLLRSHSNHMAYGYWLASTYNGNGYWIWPYLNRTPQYWMLLPPSPKP